ncbi:YceD family protein [Roseibium sp.]|uniref:YceD family protein n=1 Tax=Roseibium sp. TaxID=1936156 RepID=UPI003A97AD0D
MMRETFPYSHKISGDKIGSGQEVVLEPNKAELDRIAKAYELDGIRFLRAELALKPWHKAGIRVSGRLKAGLEQTCVVSLESFVSEIDEEIDRTFEPVSSRSRKPRDLNDDGEIEIDLETLDPPDVIVDGILDLGAVICEQLALVIDPFPKKPGVTFEAAVSGDEEEDEPAPSPFAALAKLKEDPKN